ncbi:YqcC family protein [Litorilituus lipolyticus]|uniref:YqcC family protein n=1 Tax=Litorilituus lipolyticus TaxID=2491017 RepID=A0A502KUH9_9GAMM|nr:YqcC family protein [Litorilituus lipolyticus]TPH13845.1 YqcC family protein [Litorilituus lipolyticus]
MLAEKEQQTLVLLTCLEKQLKAGNLWQRKPPSREALASELPFCYDTLRFEQWLQFIFIPKMEFIISNKHVLPTKIALTPIAEQAFNSRIILSKSIINTLSELENLLSV